MKVASQFASGALPSQRQRTGSNDMGDELYQHGDLCKAAALQNNDGWVATYIKKQMLLAQGMYNEVWYPGSSPYIQYRPLSNAIDYKGDLSNSIHAAKVTARSNLDPSTGPVWSKFSHSKTTGV